MNRAFYSATIEEFLTSSPEVVKGILSSDNSFSLEQLQRNAWSEQISILQKSLKPYSGKIYFEFSIPRMGKRIDVVLLISGTIFILEFKTGESVLTSSAINQVWDYALDLKNFHEASHNQYIAPILIIPKYTGEIVNISTTPQHPKLLFPMVVSPPELNALIQNVNNFADDKKNSFSEWENSRYSPTPTIIEAAMALYKGHHVSEISRSDASAINLTKTSESISSIIKSSKDNSRKSICFVTGVPGAGKTLVGLDIATSHIDKDSDLHSVFLSGNGPLVAILREALTRDKVFREKEAGRKIKKHIAESEVKMFIQNVHHFRDECLKDKFRPPIEHVTLFDEAQRAWNLEKTKQFMKQRKNYPNFKQSEPEFLISCLDRHPDWAVVVCLVGGGQEINTGEAGIKEWIESVIRSFKHWDIYISPNLKDNEYNALETLESISLKSNLFYKEELHLSVSMRSFRSEYVSLLIKNILDIKILEAQETLAKIQENFPIVITRDLSKAKEWLKSKASGSERYGIVVSSQAQRLKPYAIDVKSPIDPIHWFLDSKEDVRSSYYLEDVVTEFHIQGLELDWICVAWDADFRYSDTGWEYWSFVGEKWNHIRKKERQVFLKNAYRVLLTRARQGMIIVIPEGDNNDPTRKSEYYDSTFFYLREIGFPII